MSREFWCDGVELVVKVIYKSYENIAVGNTVWGYCPTLPEREYRSAVAMAVQWPDQLQYEQSGKQAGLCFDQQLQILLCLQHQFL